MSQKTQAVKNGLKSMVRATLLGLAWALVWAPIALLIGVFIIDPDNSMDEMWPMIGAYPGFLCAIIFSVILAVTNQRPHQVSLQKAALWGAVSGAIIGLLPFLLGNSSHHSPIYLATAVMGSFAAMSAASAVLSALVFRRITHNRTA